MLGPRTVATSALPVRRSYHSATSHPPETYSSGSTTLQKWVSAGRVPYRYGTYPIFRCRIHEVRECEGNEGGVTGACHQVGQPDETYGSISNVQHCRNWYWYRPVGCGTSTYLIFGSCTHEVRECEWNKGGVTAARHQVGQPDETDAGHVGVEPGLVCQAPAPVSAHRHNNNSV
jgi:hypothetical protein